jgi:phenylalanyl-tRNA synthetase beta chain
LHPGRAAQVLLNGQVIGHVGELHPRWRQAWDLSSAPVLFELDLEAVLSRVVPVAKNVSKYQPVERDLALIVPEAVTHAQLMEAIQEAPTQGLVQSAVLFDIYRPKEATTAMALGEKSLAVRVTLADMQASLTDAQIETTMSALLTQLQTRLSARLRA